MVSGANHPVEVVGRIREHPDAKQCQQQQSSALTIPVSGSSSSSVRVRTDQGYRDFVLDGVSVSGQENLPAFYAKYIESRVDDVRSGGRCTIMMYGPTGAGKSHTMFGSAREPGVAYLALHQIMSKTAAQGIQVSANVLEIYNEDVYDLLAACTNTPLSSPGPRSAKSAVSGRPKLDVRGKKVRNATSISSVDPTKLVQEIAKVEKRRVIKSTNSNDRSSRSHCMVMLEIIGVGGRLVLVDMAGSENTDQAGFGMEAKLQTGKINQGNSALKRVVECIANGNPYIPYRDSKLTMLLQDSFEDDGSKILMVLCASPDPKDVYKTICTLEYGAKAKCIVRLPNAPVREAANANSGMEAVFQARLQFKDECLERLRADYELKAKEREAELEKLAEREREVSALRKNLETVEAEWSQKIIRFQEEVDEMMKERSLELRRDLEQEMRVAATGLVVDEGRLADLERVIKSQKQEIEALRLRAEKAEAELLQLQQAAKADQQSFEKEEGLLRLDTKQLNQVSAVESLNSWAAQTCSTSPRRSPTLSSRYRDNIDEEVSTTPSACKNLEIDFKFSCSSSPRGHDEVTDDHDPAEVVSAAAARKARIQNIFLLCGDGRERFKSSGNSPRGVPLRALENVAFDSSTSPPSSGKRKSLTSRRHGENLAPISLVK